MCTGGGAIKRASPVASFGTEGEDCGDVSEQELGSSGDEL
jgi:hypothetical protein